MQEGICNTQCINRRGGFAFKVLAPQAAQAAAEAAAAVVMLLQWRRRMQGGIRGWQFCLR